VAVQLDMPREFLRLTEFLEQKRRTAAGVEPLPPQKVLNRILLNELHDQLHGLITAGAVCYYREPSGTVFATPMAPRTRSCQTRWQAAGEGEKAPSRASGPVDFTGNNRVIHKAYSKVKRLRQRPSLLWSWCSSSQR